MNSERINNHGKKQTFPFGDGSLSITELLKKPDVVSYLERNGPLTEGSRRNKLLRKLKIGGITKEKIAEFMRQQQHQRQRQIARRPRPQRGQIFKFNGKDQTLTQILEQNPNIKQAYQTRGVKTLLAHRNLLRKKLMVGRDPLVTQKQPRGKININGEKLTAREALERYPKLYDVLHTKDKRFKERSLHAKLRREIKKGKIPEYVFNPEYEITLKKILRNGVVSHYEILIPENIVTAP